MAAENKIDKDVLSSILEETFGVILKKQYGDDAHFSVVFNQDRGEIEIMLEREIVDEVTNPALQIHIDEVNKRGNEDELEVGELYREQINLMKDFGRRGITLFKQTLAQRRREWEKDVVMNEYKELLGEIVIGDIYQIRRNDILLNHNKNELLLPVNEQIPKEKYKKGASIRAVVKEVRMGRRGPEIVVSRSDNQFLKKLLELEIPEIYDGVIEIKAIIRFPGVRAKVVVDTQDKRIDPVGACIGMKGVRIHGIVRELNNEFIDVIQYSPDPKVLAQRALGNFKIKRSEVLEDQKRIRFYTDSEVFTKVAQENRLNNKLAARLTGYEVEIIRESKHGEADDDRGLQLPQMRKQLGSELVDVLLNNGYETASGVVKAGKAKLMEISELTEQHIDFILALCKEELKED